MIFSWHKFIIFLLFYCFFSQNLLPVRVSVGQLHAQLSASEPSHSIRGEDLHHPLCVSGGRHLHFKSGNPTPYSFNSIDCFLNVVSDRWRTALSRRWSPKISAWCFTPVTPSCQLLAPSGICSAPAVSAPQRGTTWCTGTRHLLTSNYLTFYLSSWQ